MSVGLQISLSDQITTVVSWALFIITLYAWGFNCYVSFCFGKENLSMFQNKFRGNSGLLVCVTPMVPKSGFRAYEKIKWKNGMEIPSDMHFMCL